MTELLDTNWVRARFPGLSDDLAFFENAGGSVPADSVIERAARYLRDDMVQLGASYPRSVRATERVGAAAGAVAELVNADASDIVLGASMSSNVYVLSHALAPLIGAGDEVVVTDVDHEANRGAWIRMAEARGATLRTWAIDRGRHELTMAGLDAALSARTKLVCFTHCSNVVGSLHDAKAFVDRVHEAGALSMIDGVAYAPHRRVDVAALGTDLYAFSLYKVYGPHLGALYVHPDLLGRLANQNHGFLAGSGTYTLMPGNVPHELAASVPGVPEYLRALDAHHGGDGTIDGAFARIAAHEQRLAEPLLAMLRGREDVRIIGRPEADAARRAPTVAFTVPGRRSRDVAEAMDAKGVAIRWGHFYAEQAMGALGIEDAEDGVIRASMVHYNTLDEVDRLVIGLGEVLG